jgi:hypothetical protein
MSNEDLPQSAEMASAYLDGELQAPERVTAAADPEVMATADSFARVRAALSQVDPVDAGTKETAIAAALAEFDTLRGASSATTVPAATATVTSLQSRRMRTYRVLTGVAAAALIGVVAVAAINSSGGNDADLSSSAATASPAEEPGLKVAAADTESAPAVTDSPVAGAAEPADAGSGADTIPAIETREALTQYAASVEIAATTAAPAPQSPGTAAPSATVAAGGNDDAAVSCLSPDLFVLGPILYQGTPALVVRDIASGALQAIADTDCRLLVEVP